MENNDDRIHLAIESLDALKSQKFTELLRSLAEKNTPEAHASYLSAVEDMKNLLEKMVG